ncbi:hypothetical protein M0R72_03500 [Candidatus Pacearchaeota archaeon]|jgi:hypothetical protein|nr:hypothetical protein [Candidatus Pacearchaeota archaeon]
MKKREYDFFRNKFGLSSIVISLILILLSLVAIGVVWAVVNGILEDASNEIGIEQFTISIDITKAYEYDGNVSVNLKRNVGSGEVVKIMFLLSDGENTESYTLESSLGELESKKFNIPVLQLNSSEIEEISVAAIFESSGGEETLGDILDTYTITEHYTEESIIVNEDGSEEIGGGSCTPNCAGLSCGPDPVCETSCGNCESGFSCSNGMCVSNSCVSNSNETTCGTSNCGTKLNNCGEVVNCGVCILGQTCKNNICSEITIINSGIVEELWPGDSGMYFGSSSLSKTTSYVGYYAKFPGSAETSCLLIVIHRFPVDGYSKSHVGFSFGTSLQVGDTYNIYSTIDGCSV